MKRIYLFSLTILFAVLSASAGYKAVITCTDGTIHEYIIWDYYSFDEDYESGKLSEYTDNAVTHVLTFNEEATVLYLHCADDVTVAYPVDFISDITFDTDDELANAPYSTDFDVAFSPDDETSYTSVTEKVVTSETADDYGDFIENFEDDDESKGTVTITWSGTTASVTHNPSSLKNSVVVASATSSDVIIYSSKKVDFILKGATDDGSLTLYSEKKCSMTLDGVSITNSDGAAINMPKKTVGTVAYGGKTCYVVLKGASSLTDGKTYSSAVSGEDMKATLFSEGQLIFSGTGTLNVTSRYGHGIASDDYIRIRGGKHNPDITVTSAKDGISVNDYLLMYGGTVTVVAVDDGIDVGKGYVAINGGKLTVVAIDEGIAASYQGESDGTVDASINPSITIAGGLVTVATTGDKGHAIRARRDITVTGGIVRTTVKGAGSKGLNADGAVTITGGKVVGMAEGLPVYDEEEDDLSSAAGIRSKSTITISGNAVIGLKATADGGKGINSNGLITLTGGKVTVVTLGSKYTFGGSNSRARGITADVGLDLSGGELRICSMDDALYTPEILNVSGGSLQAYSSSSQSLRYGTFMYTGGWIVYK